jgi:signal peptidase II
LIRDFLIFISVFALDQLSKLFVVKTIPLNSVPTRILSTILRLHHVKNEGVAFGITLGNPFIFKVTSVLTVIFVIFFYFHIPREHSLKRIAIAIIAGGALGNVVDRLLYGQVTDFILIGYRSINWPVFNVADIAVTVGIVLYLYLIMIRKDEELPVVKELQPDSLAE